MAESDQHNTQVPQSYNPAGFTPTTEEAHAQQASSTGASCAKGTPPPPTRLNTMLSIAEVLQREANAKRTYAGVLRMAFEHPDYAEPEGPT